ncbi:MAG: substrate-binding domain-containing protein [Phycisphaeraceae bacterium]
MTRSRQVAQSLRREIQRGRWSVGEKLPSSRQIAAEHGISLNTAHAVLRHLEALSLIECRPRRRPVVRSREGDHVAARARLVAMISHTGTSLPRDRHTSPDMFFAAEHVLTGAGYVLTNLPQKLTCDADRPALLQHLDELGGELAGVIVLAQTSAGHNLTEELLARDIPVVQIGRPYESRVDHYVEPDFAHGGQAVGRMLGALACRKLLFIHTTPLYFRHKRTLTGLVQGYLDLDAPLPVIDRQQSPDGYSNEEQGYRAMKMYLERHDPPEGVYAVGDYVAKGAIAALREVGLRVPADVNVLGATGLEISQYFDPPLTVLGRPLQQMGAAAAEMLLALIDEPSDVPSGQDIPCALTLRRTVRLTDAVREALSDCEQVTVEDESDVGAT